MARQLCRYTANCIPCSIKTVFFSEPGHSDGYYVHDIQRLKLTKGYWEKWILESSVLPLTHLDTLLLLIKFTLSTHQMYTFFTKCTIFIHQTYTFTHQMYTFTHQMYTFYLPNAQFLFTKCTIFIHQMYTFTQQIYTFYSPNVPFLFTKCTFLLTKCTLFTNQMFTFNYIFKFLGLTPNSEWLSLHIITFH